MKKKPTNEKCKYIDRITNRERKLNTRKGINKELKFKQKHIYSLLLRLLPLVLVLPPINIKPNATEASMATLPSDLIQNLVLQHYVFTSWCIRYFLLSQKLRWIVVIALWFCCWTNLILARRGQRDEGLKERNVKKSTLTVSDIHTSAKKNIPLTCLFTGNIDFKM